MRKILLIIVGVIFFTFVGCTGKAAEEEKIVENYVKSFGYNIISRKGEVHKYVLDRSKLYGSLETLQYQQAWSVQTVEPDKYFGKEIKIYSLKVRNHPLEKIDKKYKGADLFIMLSEGTIIGGYSYPATDEVLLGSYYSLEGKTLEEVTGLSYKQWGENWKKRYGVNSDSINKSNTEQSSSKVPQEQSYKSINARVINDQELKVGNKPILQLKYSELIKIWGKPNEVKKVEVYFPATVEPSYLYILKYDSIDIEMYPVQDSVSVEATESFRFDITGSNYDFYGVKVGMTLEDYLKTVENKNIYSIKEILSENYTESIPYQYTKLLTMIKEKNYYSYYEKAIYEQVIINDFPYGAVMLFKDNRLSRIVYGYPNAS